MRYCKQTVYCLCAFYFIKYAYTMRNPIQESSSFLPPNLRDLARLSSPALSWLTAALWRVTPTTPTTVRVNGASSTMNHTCHFVFHLYLFGQEKTNGFEVCWDPFPNHFNIEGNDLTRHLNYAHYEPFYIFKSKQTKM